MYITSWSFLALFGFSIKIKKQKNKNKLAHPLTSLPGDESGFESSSAVTECFFKPSYPLSGYFYF